MICLFRSADANSGKVVQKIPRSWYKRDVWILVSLGEYLRTHVEEHTRYDRGPEIHGKPRRVSLLVGEAQLAGCLRVQAGGPLEWERRHAQGVIQDTVDEASVSTATPDWRKYSAVK